MTVMRNESNAANDALDAEVEVVKEAVKDTVKGTLHSGVDSVFPAPLKEPLKSAPTSTRDLRGTVPRVRDVEASAESSDDAPPAIEVPFAGKPGAAAFFDVDNTLMYGASIYWVGRGMSRRGVITSRDVLRFAWKQARFRFHGAEVHGHISSVKTSALELVAGYEVKMLRQLCEEVYDRDISPRILEPVREIAAAHIAAGQEVWLVTASPVELAEIMASRLGLTGALGTVAEVEDGYYTGRLVGDLLHGPAKAVRINELSQERGLNLQHSTAYSDSANDLPMLNEAAHAVAVNPDARLAKEARTRGWEIQDFRRGRRAFRYALPATALAGVVAGGWAWHSRRKLKGQY